MHVTQAEVHLLHACMYYAYTLDDISDTAMIAWLPVPNGAESTRSTHKEPPLTRDDCYANAA